MSRREDDRRKMEVKNSTHSGEMLDVWITPTKRLPDETIITLIPGWGCIA